MDNQIVHRTTAADAGEALEIFTIYERPADYPAQYVVRRWRIVAGVNDPVPDLDAFAVAMSRDAARAAIPAGRVRLERSANDEPQILESWV
jgi:hypothetical protein